MIDTAALRTPQGFRAWRRERKLSQVDLAALLEVTNTTVHRWEVGERPIPHTVALALLYLGLTNAHVLGALPDSHAQNRVLRAS